MRVKDGKLLLAGLHFERLFAGMHLLQFSLTEQFTAEYLTEQVLRLCHVNGHARSARVRLVVFRRNGALNDPLAGPADLLIESYGWEPGAAVEQGLRIGLFPQGRKACDIYSNCKSNNYLLYTMAAGYARDNGWDDCLVLNSHERIADSTIANLFYVKGGVVYTPPLGEGCVAGVMRRYLLETLPDRGIRVEERAVTVEALEDAEEVFLTNAMRGIRWVRRFGDFEYGHQLIDLLRYEKK